MSDDQLKVFLEAVRADRFAKARIVKLGRRTANLSIEAWQDDPARPIASAVMNVMVTTPGPAAD